MVFMLKDDLVNQLVSRNQNFHGRRITNAGASKDLNDYVIRKELNDAVVTLTATKPIKVDDKVKTKRIYTLSKEGTLAIQNDSTPRLYIVEDKTPEVGISFVNVRVTIAPVGNVVTVIIKQNTTTWMTLTILAGTSSINATNAQIAAADNFVLGNYVRVDITVVGSTVPGSNLIITIGI